MTKLFAQAFEKTSELPGVIEEIIRKRENEGRSEPLGIDTSMVEVTNISRHGLWVLVDEEELFLPFEEFPWFMEASVAAIMNVERLGDDLLHWPALDVDLTLGSIRHPEKYPLIAKANIQRSAPYDRG
jgi:hypothetical protein